MNVSFLDRRGDVLTQMPRVSAVVSPAMRLADVVTEYVVGPITAASYLTTEAGGRLLTEGGDLLTTEF